MFESHIITLIESYSVFPLLQMVQCQFNIKKHEVSTYWQKKPHFIMGEKRHGK